MQRRPKCEVIFARALTPYFLELVTSAFVSSEAHQQMDFDQASNPEPLMDDIFTRFLQDLLDRLTGPMRFRLLIQPAVALLFGIRDGLRDARLGRRPYLWLLSTDLNQRGSLLREGWHAVAKVFFLALLFDIIYQIVVLEFIYPGEAVLTAILLALLPYVLIRGPTNRIARVYKRRQ
jgi:hypothetical protein